MALLDAHAESQRRAVVEARDPVAEPATPEQRRADALIGMIGHHQGAIDMAEVELKYGKDAKVRKLAQAVIDAQKEEIRQMREWLREMDGKR